MIKLKDGELAPDFVSKDQNGNPFTLSSLRGSRVILYFYPRDNTLGCSAEACSLRDGKSELTRMGFIIVGVSPDSEKSHQKFIEKKDLDFTLIADTDHSVAELYGVWALKKFMGKEYMGILRTTFIIDEQGLIEKIFEKVDTKNHFEQIVDSYK